MPSYRELLVQRAELEKRIEEARNMELASAIAQVKQLIAEYGLTAQDCGFKLGIPVISKAPQTVAVKYRGPNGETWTGRGKAPNWLVNLEKQHDRDRSEFLVSR